MVKKILILFIILLMVNNITFVQPVQAFALPGTLIVALATLLIAGGLTYVATVNSDTIEAHVQDFWNYLSEDLRQDVINGIVEGAIWLRYPLLKAVETYLNLVKGYIDEHGRFEGVSGKTMHLVKTMEIEGSYYMSYSDATQVLRISDSGRYLVAVNIPGIYNQKNLLITSGQSADVLNYSTHVGICYIYDGSPITVTKGLLMPGTVYIYTEKDTMNRNMKMQCSYFGTTIYHAPGETWGGVLRIGVGCLTNENKGHLLVKVYEVGQDFVFENVDTWIPDFELAQDDVIFGDSILELDRGIEIPQVQDVDALKGVTAQQLENIEVGVGGIYGVLQNIYSWIVSIGNILTVGLVGNPSDIDTTPLRIVGYTFTNKFPFSLPWDLKEAISNFAIIDEFPVYHVVIPTGPLEVDLEFDITIPEEFNIVLVFIRSSFLLMFIIGLIWGTSKLVGGDR